MNVNIIIIGIVKHMVSKFPFEKGFMLIPEESIGPCLTCGSGTIIKFCRKYDGYIGKCTVCNTNWKESWTWRSEFLRKKSPYTLKLELGQNRPTHRTWLVNDSIWILICMFHNWLKDQLRKDQYDLNIWLLNIDIGSVIIVLPAVFGFKIHF